jgi:signal transduction histidine kinase
MNAQYRSRTLSAARLAARAPLPRELLRLPSEGLPEYFELAAYFVVTEALTSIAKHASASQVSLSVTGSDRRLEVAISDEGLGAADPGLGRGLRGLSDRLAAIEGQLKIESKPGRGTTVRARIPCPDTQGEAPA